MPSITGSSSHPTGVAVGTYLFGPEAMPALALITLVFQALLLAHGGLTTLGRQSVLPRHRWTVGHVAVSAALDPAEQEARDRGSSSPPWRATWPLT